jgi:hypothetical protein
MARQCPRCQTRIPAVRIAAYSDSLECPGCSSPLEVAAGARYLASATGLAGAAGLVWWMTPAERSLDWTVPTLAAFLAYSVTAAVVVMLIGDLVPRTVSPAAPTGNAAAGHGGHGGHH